MIAIIPDVFIIVKSFRDMFTLAHCLEQYLHLFMGKKCEKVASLFYTPVRTKPAIYFIAHHADCLPERFDHIVAGPKHKQFSFCVRRIPDSAFKTRPHLKTSRPQPHTHSAQVCDQAKTIFARGLR